MIKAAFIIEAIINLIAGIWWLIYPSSQFKLTFPEKYFDNNPALMLLAQWWGVLLLTETVLLYFGIYHPEQRMMIYIVMLAGEIFVIPPIINFMVREKVTRNILNLLVLIIIFALIRLFLMYKISLGAT